jgi:membrane-bound lytic murein transglycosylase D
MAPHAGLSGDFDTELDDADIAAPQPGTADLWTRLRAGYGIDPGADNAIENAAVEKELNWYRTNADYLYLATERASRYLHYVVAAAEQRNMPTELALLPIVESAYNPFAYSRSGAAGLWQFMPATGRLYGLKQNWWYDGRKDVVASTDAALDHLQYLYEHFNKDWLIALAAYNYGEGNIQRAIDANRRLGKPTDFWHLDIREETSSYVPKLLALAKIVKAPRRYGVKLCPVPDAAYFATIKIPGQIDLAEAASLAQVDIDEIYRLNPGLNHWATDPQGPQRLLLPVDTVARFTRQLSARPAKQRPNWAHYAVKKGDTLSGIARKFHLDVAALRSVNRLDNTVLRPGQGLLIPQGGSRQVADASRSSGQRAAPYSSRQVIHQVGSGETLQRISRRYGVTVADVARWNGLDPAAAVRPGRRLSIWTAPPHGSSQKVGYTVRSGDSLYAIATRFKVQVDDIARWNRVEPSSPLQPGQHLTLFVDARL